ncbi:hypothetical protein E4U11_001004 [Claviceps purpurea]|nr:hypothetical protein E4U11_001004 [Claviceps purpurea]
MPSTHKKEKPWDTVDIDKWEFDTFTAKDNAGGTFTEESSPGHPFSEDVSLAGCTILDPSVLSGLESVAASDVVSRTPVAYLFYTLVDV